MRATLGLESGSSGQDGLLILRPYLRRFPAMHTTCRFAGGLRRASLARLGVPTADRPEDAVTRTIPHRSRKGLTAGALTTRALPHTIMATLHKRDWERGERGRTHARAASRDQRADRPAPAKPGRSGPSPGLPAPIV